MRRFIVIAALLLFAGNAFAETDRDILARKAAKVGSKNKLCTCDAPQFYGRIGRLQVFTGGNLLSASCQVPFFDQFGKINAGAGCSLFTVLP
jgi:hypothetical protein